MTVKKVIISDDALLDLEAGKDFYEDKQTGLGFYFVTSLLSDVASLRLYSGNHPIRFGYHRMLSKRFPFAVYYEVIESATRVVAILDMRRNPELVRQVIKDR